MIHLLIAILFKEPYSLEKRFITNTDFRAFEDVDYNENLSFSISIYLGELGDNNMEENIAITYLDNQTLLKILPYLQNTNISRKGKVEILRKYSPTPLCETGRFVNRIKTKCFLHVRKGGRLIFISTAEELLDVSLEVSGYYYSTLYYSITMIPAIVLVLGIASLIFEVIIFTIW